jgi:hypothetical protein
MKFNIIIELSDKLSQLTAKIYSQGILWLTTINRIFHAP